MIRMEIACFLVLGMVALMYFPAQKKQSKLHQTFSILLIVSLIHLLFDAITIYTVNHLNTVSPLLNDFLHRMFMGTMVLVFSFIVIFLI